MKSKIKYYKEIEMIQTFDYIISKKLKAKYKQSKHDIIIDKLNLNNNNPNIKYFFCIAYMHANHIRYDKFSVKFK